MLAPFPFINTGVRPFTIDKLMITVLLAKPERGAEDIHHLKTQVKKLENIFSRPAIVEEGEVPHPLKLIQIHLKHTLLNSEKIKGSTLAWDVTKT